VAVSTDFGKKEGREKKSGRKNRLHGKSKPLIPPRKREEKPALGQRTECMREEATVKGERDQRTKVEKGG